MPKTMRERQTYAVAATVTVDGLQLPAGTYQGAETWTQEENPELDERPTPTRHVLRLRQDQQHAMGWKTNQPFVDVDVTALVRSGQIEPQID